MDNPQETKVKKPLSLGKKLELKSSADVQQVRQSFSHGRSKTVVVEVKKKRASTAARPAQAPEAVQESSAVKTAETPQVLPQASLGVKPSHLTESEWEARRRALQNMKESAADLSGSEWQEEWSRHRDSLVKVAEKPLEDETKEPEASTEGPQVASHDVAPSQEMAETQTAPKPSPYTNTNNTPTNITGRVDDRRFIDEEEPSKKRSSQKADAHKKSSSTAKREQTQPKAGKVNIRNILDDSMEFVEKTRSLAALRRAREKEKMKMRTAFQEPVKVFRDVVIPETLTVQELANRMAERSGDVIKALMKMGMMATINQVIDADTAELVVSEFGHRPQRISDSDIEQGLETQEDKPEDLRPRPPVVTIMGHVDHGKTSLLDAIRKTDVVSSEAGGITQHIGAYQIKTPSGQLISFIDTPGHAAFTAMRSRGAQVTDIVVLVVAGDDGVKEQTIEAIRHAQAAQVPIVVAINKMDKPDAQSERVLSDLTQYDVVAEQYGGDVLSVEVSARTGMNLEKLEEAILLQAEMLRLTANPSRPAQGVVIEARIEKGRGPVSTILIQKGTLRVGDIFVSGRQWGKVRSLHNHHGQKIEEALPSLPVEVVGFDAPSDAGDVFVVVESEAKARQIAEYRSQKLREQKLAASLKKRSDLQGFQSPQAPLAKEVAVLIKADVQGSAEALSSSLMKLSTEEVCVRVLHAAVGPINESDILLAAASKAIVLGFNVRANPQARDLARQEDVAIHYYSIIYNAIEDVKAKMSGVLSPIMKENIIGYAQVRQIFNITKVGKIAGCMVTEGLVKRGAKVRLLRDGVVIHEGALKTLKRFKEEMREVRVGYDCGMAFENYHDLQENDQIECFELEAIQRVL